MKQSRVSPVVRSLSTTKWLLLLSILVVAAVMRFSVLTLPMHTLDSHYIVDDSYLYLDIAQHIADGQGPRYGDHYTNGFQPLYGLLLAATIHTLPETHTNLIARLDKPVKAAIAISCGFDMLCVLLIGLIVSRRYGWTAPSFFVMAVWAVHPLFIYMAVHPMETSLAAACFLWVWYLFENHRSALLLGLACGIAVLARIDLLIMAGLVCLYHLWHKQWRSLLLILLGMSVVYLPWAFYSWHYTHQLFPESGRALRQLVVVDFGTYPLFSIGFREALTSILCNSPLLWLICLTILLFALLNDARHKQSGWANALLSDLRSYCLPASFAVLLFIAYSCYSPAPWYLPRYLYLVVLVPLLFLAASIHCLQDHARHKLFATVASCVVLALFCFSSYTLINQRTPANNGYRQMALWVHDHCPAGTVIGATQTGALSYYNPQLKVINLDGVVNPDALQAIRQQRLTRYIEASGVQYLLLWSDNLFFINQTSKQHHLVAYTLQGTIPKLHTWGFKWFIYQRSPLPEIASGTTTA